LARKGPEYLWLERARTAKTYQPAIDALKQAYAVEPKNPETPYAIGEYLRDLSWRGNAGYEALAREAVDWLDRWIRLNKYDPHNYFLLGMCLDWLDQKAKATPYFDQALKLDPNNHIVVTRYGWHAIELGDYSAAKRWFERSLQLLDNYNNRNSMAANYLEIVNRRLAEATNPPPFTPVNP